MVSRMGNNMYQEQSVKSDYLYHHGIIGMKWGVRRFQNKDGSLTPAGERHRDKYESKLSDKAGKAMRKTQEIEDKYHRGKISEVEGLRRLAKVDKEFDKDKAKIEKKAYKAERKEKLKEVREDLKSERNAFDFMVLGPSFTRRRAAKMIVDHGRDPVSAMTNARFKTIGQRVAATTIAGVLGSVTLAALRAKGY